jgi:hypothetical protein
MVSAPHERYKSLTGSMRLNARTTCLSNRFRSKTPVSTAFSNTKWLKNTVDTRVWRKKQNVSLYNIYCGRVGCRVVKRREAETPPA